MSIISDWLHNRYANAAGTIEVRVMDAEGTITARAWCNNSKQVERLVAQAGRTQSVFYGLATRNPKAGKKQDVVCVPFLWADVDVVKLGWDMEATKRAVHYMDPKFAPTAIVHSGGGLHLYWQLKEPIGLDPASPDWADRVRAIEDANKELARLTHGDRVFDLTRVLRMPDSHNPKKGTNKCVEVVSDCWWRTFDFDSLFSALKEQPNTLLDGKFVATASIKKEPGSPLSYLEAFAQAMQAGNKGARRKRKDDIEDRMRVGGTGFPYIGIDEAMTRLVALEWLDHETTTDPENTVADLVFKRIERVMRRHDPADWAEWDHKAERAKILQNIERFKPKWHETKARMKLEARQQTKADGAAAKSKTASKP